MSSRDAKLATAGSGKRSSAKGEMDGMRAASAEIQKMRISAQKELQLARQARAEAERYLREIQTKSRSQAQLLILQARLETKKQIAEISRKAGEEIQKALADMRLIKNAAQKELEAQQKFTNAARLKALALVFPEKGEQWLESEEGEIGVRKV